MLRMKLYRTNVIQMRTQREHTTSQLVIPKLDRGIVSSAHLTDPSWDEMNSSNGTFMFLELIDFNLHSVVCLESVDVSVGVWCGVL